MMLRLFMLFSPLLIGVVLAGVNIYLGNYLVALVNILTGISVFLFVLKYCFGNEALLATLILSLVTFPVELLISSHDNFMSLAAIENHANATSAFINAGLSCKTSGDNLDRVIFPGLKSCAMSDHVNLLHFINDMESSVYLPAPISLAEQISSISAKNNTDSCIESLKKLKNICPDSLAEIKTILAND